MLQESGMSSIAHSCRLILRLYSTILATYDCRLSARFNTAILRIFKLVLCLLVV